ncbi:MAG: glycosyltransferase family 4 protein [Candidatus Saganbacteria bacterium]|nr:glycosyltransferase family 4 protein [Candidatus Saganbacteria bacterium]
MNKKKVLVFYYGGVYGGVNAFIDAFTSMISEKYSYKTISLRSLQGEGPRKNNPLLKSRVVSMFNAFSRLFLNIRSQEYDIIVSNELTTAVFCCIIKVFRKNIRHVCVVHCNYKDIPIGFAWRSVIQAFKKVLIKNTDKFVCVSKFVAQTISDYGVEQDKIEVIYNCIKSQENIRIDKEQTCNSRVNIAYIGRLSKEKGVDILLKIADGLLPLKEKVAFKILGDGAMQDQVASYSGLHPEYFRYRGFVRDPFDDKDMDILIMPSRSEGFPIVLLEAMQNGALIIAANVGGIPEIVINGYNGILCGQSDVNAYCEAVKRLISDGDLRYKLRHNAIDTMRNKFSFEIAKEKYLSLLDQLEK